MGLIERVRAGHFRQSRLDCLDYWFGRKQSFTIPLPEEAQFKYETRDKVGIDFSEELELLRIEMSKETENG